MGAFTCIPAMYKYKALAKSDGCIGDFIMTISCFTPIYLYVAIRVPK